LDRHTHTNAYGGGKTSGGLL